MFFVVGLGSSFKFTAATMPAQNWWADVNYGNGVYVASGGNADGGTIKRLARSTDNGATWAVCTGTNIPGSVYAVRYNSGFDSWFFLDFGNLKFGTSFDSGATFGTANQSPVTSTIRQELTSYTAGTYLYTQGSSTNTFIQFSPSGNIFTSHARFPSARVWGPICWNGTTAVCLGDGAPTTDACYSTSPTTATWTAVVLPVSSTWNSLVWDGTYFVATGGAGACVRSLDGITWTAVTIFSTYPVTGYGNLTFDNYGMMAVMTDGTIGMPVPRYQDGGGGYVNSDDFFISKDHGTSWSGYKLPTTAYWIANGSSGTNFALAAYTAGTEGSTVAAYSTGNP